ncbi:LysE family translocator [Lederbergia lenta]|uniref:Homoserine/threonine resistance transporter n=1 Tax=Lederbergia lenta TaxID=1467 RepID=A0A2X4WHR9_LEDLE|nr:LysE family transporter [Lederbergia lenta]MCM3109679.1 LysE family translocator [Lederbergia lenta]MEC2324570.1 LysE family transporter [Lederbergia lenta]SQI59428.1 homoserine/threonine resistance transporter [Lederbergia lenta]
MGLFFTYVLAGLAIAMPVGAITVEMTKQGLKKGFMHGWSVGLGGMTVDLLLIIALYMGLASVLAIPFIQIPMWLIGAGFLAFLGYDSIKNSEQDITMDGEKSNKSFLTSYRNGLLVAVSPGNLVFWVSVFGAVLSDSYDAAQPSNFLIVGTGILVGILIHDIGLLTIISVTRKVMNRAMIKWVSIIAGIILIGFAGYFLYEFGMAVKGIL